MQTGLVPSWNVDPMELGPLYPFVGSEMILFVVCVALWVAFTVWQMRFETERNDAAAQALAERQRRGDTTGEKSNP